MKRIATLLLPLLLPALICAGGIVPEPASMTPGKGSLKISGAIFKCDPSIDSVSMDAICRFAARLSLVSGRTSSVSTPVGLKSVVDDGAAKGIIFLKDNSLMGESYRISIGQKSAVVRAGATPGFLNSIQTLKQMLPEEIYGDALADKQKWALPRCEISDSPATAVRGLSIDSCETFWSVEQILSCLDEMARYKFNLLLWNLAGERGWRMEVRAYPLLGQVAGYRMESEGRYGGYYSTDEILRVVRHASSLGISIIPRLHIGLEATSILKPADCPAERFVSDILAETAQMFPYIYEDVSCDGELPLEDMLRARGKEPAPAGEFPEVNPASPDTRQLRMLAGELW